MSYWTGAFWQATAERAISTAAQAALLVIGADQVNAISGVEWQTVAGFAAGGAVLAVLKALAAGVKDGNPSLGSQEVVPGNIVQGRGGYLEGQSTRPGRHREVKHDPNLRA